MPATITPQERKFDIELLGFIWFPVYLAGLFVFTGSFCIRQMRLGSSDYFDGARSKLAAGEATGA
jgi:hypothetical protein